MQQRVPLFLLCAFLLHFSLLDCATAKAWTPSTFPNPQVDLKRCGRRGVPSFICDPDAILAYEDANAVEGLITKIAIGESPFIKAPCGELGMRGFQVAVAVMNRFELGKYADEASAAQGFARALHDDWGVGDKACQNGLLLLLAVDNRQSYVSTGAGVVGILPDSTLRTILDNMKPALRQERYGDAVLEGVQQLGMALAGSDIPPGGDEDGGDGWGIFIFIFILVAIVFAYSWWSSRKETRRYRSCEDKLASVVRDQGAIRRRQYAASSCPICLEEFADGPVGGPEAGEAAGEAKRSKGEAGPGAAAGGAVGGAGGEGEPLLTRQAAGEEAGPSSLGSRSVGRNSSGSNSSKGKGGKSGTTEAGAGRCRKQLVLRCGHTFCESCISEWLKSHTNCPICRKDLDGEDRPSSSNATRTNPPGFCGTEQQQQQHMREELLIAEQMFRLRRLQYLYPDYVSNMMLQQWEEDLQRDRDLDARAFQAMNPAIRRELESRGQGGSSMTFGGGGSSGGGGAGSSW